MMTLFLGSCGKPPEPPQLLGFAPASLIVPVDGSIIISVRYVENDSRITHFAWAVDGGEIKHRDNASITYQAPNAAGDYRLAVTIGYADSNQTVSLDGLITIVSATQPLPMAMARAQTETTANGLVFGFAGSKAKMTATGARRLPALPENDGAFGELVRRTLTAMNADCLLAAMTCEQAGHSVGPDRLPFAPETKRTSEFVGVADIEWFPMTETAPQPMGSSRDYVVQKGDTLTGIADQFYGNGAPPFWRRIYKANQEAIGDNPSRLSVGTRLIIP